MQLKTIPSVAQASQSSDSYVLMQPEISEIQFIL